MAAQVWDSNDGGYEQWLVSHPHGFMANTGRPAGGHYYKIHAASGVAQSSAARPGDTRSSRESSTASWRAVSCERLIKAFSRLSGGGRRPDRYSLISDSEFSAIPEGTALLDGTATHEAITDLVVSSRDSAFRDFVRRLLLGRYRIGTN